MNHIKLIVAILLLNSSVFAQKNLFIQPYIGAGTTGAIGGQISSVIQKNITSVTAGVNLGKSFGRLNVNTGAAFLTRGFMWDNLSFESMYDPATGMAYDTATVDITVTHKHLLVPLTAGFSILKGEKFSVIPRAGIDMSFNLGSQSKWVYADGSETKTKLNGPAIRIQRSAY